MRAVVKPPRRPAVVCETVGSDAAIASICGGETRERRCRVTVGSEEVRFTLFERTDKPGGPLVAIGNERNELPERAAEEICRRLDEIAARAPGRRSTRSAISWALDHRRRR